MVELKRFCIAPRPARMLDTWLNAPSSTEMAALAPATVAILDELSCDSAAEAPDKPPKVRSAPPRVKLLAELKVMAPRVVTPLPSAAATPAVVKAGEIAVPFVAVSAIAPAAATVFRPSSVESSTSEPPVPAATFVPVSTVVRPAVLSASIAASRALIAFSSPTAAATTTATLPAVTNEASVTNWYVRSPKVIISPRPAPVPVVIPVAAFVLASMNVRVTLSLPLALAPAEISRPVAFWIFWAITAVPPAPVKATLRPSDAVSVSAPVDWLATAVTPVVVLTALMAVTALLACVIEEVLLAIEPTAMPLISRSPLASPRPALGATPTNVVFAVAATPVWLVALLIVVVLAVALSAVTPAALVAAEAPTSIPLMVKPAPSKALDVTATPVA